MQILVDTRVG